MSENFTVSNYKAENKTVYNSLIQKGITADSELAKIDTNKDNKISEDELIAFVDETSEVNSVSEVDAGDKTKDDSEDDEKTSSSSDDDTKKMISLYDAQCVQLETRISKLYAQISGTTSSDDVDSILSEINAAESELNTARQNIYNLLVASEQKELEAKQAAIQASIQNSINQANSTTNNAYSNISGRNTTSSAASSLTSKAFSSEIVNTAKSYVGKLKESDGSYKLVTNGRSEAWCADFVTYVVNQASSATGVSLSNFGSASVSGLMAWGQANNTYTSTTSMSSSEKASWIASNVKPGDIMIMKSNGASHTGIVTKVNSDGSFETVEGNTSDQCLSRSYSATESRLSGFISM